MPSLPIPQLLLQQISGKKSSTIFLPCSRRLGGRGTRPRWGGTGGFQFVDLSKASPTFSTPFVSLAPKSPFGSNISEDILIDPIRNLILSPNEIGNYELVDVTKPTAPVFYENNAVPSAFLDSAGEDCSTGIALAGGEGTSPSQAFIADLTQRKLTAGTPGSWAAPSQYQTLAESVLAAGASGLAVAQGTHTGIVSGEFGGNTITAIALPPTSGSGTPAITNWVTCEISATFSAGFDPHTVTAYKSPMSGHAIALVENGAATQMAVVDLTMMLALPRDVPGHSCSPLTLPATVVSFIAT